MSKLSNEDKKRKELLLKEVKKVREKQKEYGKRREEIWDKLNPTSKLDEKISKLQRNISSNEFTISHMEESIESRVKDGMLENKREIITSSATKAQELRNQLAVAKEKQKEEQIELQRLEQKYSLPTERPKGILASAISLAKRFINRKNIAIEKQQTEIDIKMTRDRVDEATRRVNDIEEKLRHEERMAQSYQSDYEEEEKEKRIEEEKKIKEEIQQKKEEIERQKREKEMLEAERQEVLKGQEKMTKEEREELKQKRREAMEGIQETGKEIRRLQAQIKEIDPNHYVAGGMIMEMFKNIIIGDNTFQQATKTEEQQPESKKQQEETREPVKEDDKYAAFRKRQKREIKNEDGHIEQNALKKVMEEESQREGEESKIDTEKGIA